jgi:hypothetical protein
LRPAGIWAGRGADGGRTGVTGQTGQTGHRETTLPQETADTRLRRRERPIEDPHPCNVWDYLYPKRCRGPGAGCSYILKRERREGRWAGCE